MNEAEKAERNREKQRKHYYAHHEEIKARRAKLRAQNKEVVNARKREHRARLKAAGIYPTRKGRVYDPTKEHEYWIRRRFGLSPTEYKRLLALQGGGCAICGAETSVNGQRLAVDHDHTTGAIRGLLCRSCNLGIGYFRDNPDLLARAVEYLNRSRSASIVDRSCSALA